MGGNDGLNTVVPYADSLYPTLRSRIGIPVGSVLHLDGALGLNPVMTGMKALWDAQRVAVVTNVGYPNSSLSHFSARDIWHTADPLLAAAPRLARPLGRRHARGRRAIRSRAPRSRSRCRRRCSPTTWAFRRS